MADFKNAEGYADPTAFHAFCAVEKDEKDRAYRPIVYICSPYSGDTDANTRRARLYSRFAVEMGAIPIAPHLLFPQFLSEETERDLAMFMDLVVLGRCEELWAFGIPTAGMKREMDKARRKNKKIRCFTEEMKEVTKNVDYTE